MKLVGLVLLGCMAVAFVVGCSGSAPEGDNTPPPGAVKSGTSSTSPGGGGGGNAAQTKPTPD